MNLRRLVTCISLLGSAVLIFPEPASSQEAEIDAAIPKDYPIERYRAVWEKSPFEIVTPPPPPKPKESPQFAKTLSVAGVIEIGDLKNVTIFDRASGEYFVLGPKKTHQGIRMVSVVNDIDPKKVKVKIAKGKNEGTIGFDVKMLAANTKPPGRAAKPQNVAPSIPPIRKPGVGAPGNGQPAGGNQNSPGAGGTNSTGPGGPAAPNSSGATPQQKPNPPVRKPPSPKERLRIVVPGPTA